MAVNLVKRPEHKAAELYLSYRPHSVDSQPNTCSDNPKLCKRSVNHPVLSELLLQTICRPENTTIQSNIFSQDHDFVVLFHLLLQCKIHCLNNVCLNHFI